MIKQILTLLFLLILNGCEDPKSLSGSVEFLSMQKEKLLRGSVIVKVFQDQEGKNLATELKMEKPYQQVKSYRFNIDLSDLEKKGVKMEEGVFIQAVFDGVEPLKENPNKGIGPITKQSFILGPLKGEQKNIILHLD